MAIIKCKMCGGDVELAADKTFGTCEFCGSTMTFPKVDDEQRAAAFNRGNHFRRIGEFDKALAVYERIVREDDADAEAHWCCALCRFGIEYVEDPATYEYVPTCHRASFDSFLEDVDYLAAVAHSEGVTKRQYQKDGAKIAEVQRGILATSQSEEPFDVFICYKESDEQGQRTRDSLMAQDVYYQLTDQGYRVFFARITLEDVAGKEYEPYIFAALNSAKVMIVVGSKPEHMNAVWVKNEWSRFLAMMKKDHSKLLLPCYRDMDPYDMPEQLSVLQSYDMSKIGFIQDLVRGIKKVLEADKKPDPVKETVVVQQGAVNTAPLLKRAFMFLEDGDWSSADEYCEKVLDIDPENARAYLGKLMAELRVKKQESLKDCAEPFDGSNNYQKAVRFGITALTADIEYIKTRNENARLEGTYSKAAALVKMAKTNSVGRKENFFKAKELFDSIPDYKDATQQAALCLTEAENARKDEILTNGNIHMRGGSVSGYEAAIKELQKIPGWKDADEKLAQCRKSIEEIKAKEEAARLERQRQEEIAMAEAARKKKLAAIIGAAAAAVAGIVIIFVAILNTWIIPGIQYNKAVALAEDGNDTAAAICFGKAGDFKDAAAQSRNLWAQVTHRETVSTGGYHTVGLKSDGTVVAVGWNDYGQCDVSEWTDIVAVSAGYYHTVGLKSDGTVVAVGWNDYGQCDVSGWTDVVAISAGAAHTVGLKSDGAVVAVGRTDNGQCNVSGWTEIVAVSAGYYHTVGLQADGTVVAVGDNDYGQCDVSEWTDIVAISAGAYHTVGLKSDGTVVAVGSNDDGQCNVSEWSNIKTN